MSGLIDIATRSRAGAQPRLELSRVDGAQAGGRAHRRWWIDLLIGLVAAGGLTASALYDVQFRTSTFAASDFKTLYASVWCFLHRMNAYSIPNLQRVFVANGVVQPERWYGHAPVYPWTTLAALIPFSTVGMVTAMYAMTIASGVLWAIAVIALMRYAATHFDLEAGWRIVIAFLCVCGPLLAFGLDVGNVSIAVSALCFLAFAWRNSGSPLRRKMVLWFCSAALAFAFLLKPHVTVWVGIGMLLLPERAARAVAIRAGVLLVGFTTVLAAGMAALGILGLETHAYLAMLVAETSAGASMNATSREILPVVAQITSLDSIVGFWIQDPGLRAFVTIVMLVTLAYLVFRQTRRVLSERGALLAVGSWCLLGMLATYHRAHDAVALLIVTPWIVDRIRRAPLAWHAWAATILYAAMSASAAFPNVVQWVSASPKYSLVAFLLLRQVGLAALLLIPVLLLATERERREARMRELPNYETTTELQAAA